MRIPQPGEVLIEITLTMNCYNAFTPLWKKKIRTPWLAKPKNSSWDLLKSWKLAQRKLPLSILLKSLKCKYSLYTYVQVFSWNQFHENFRKNGSQFTSVKLYLFFFDEFSGSIDNQNIYWLFYLLNWEPQELLMVAINWWWKENFNRNILKMCFVVTSRNTSHVSIVLLFYHSPEIRGLCLMKCFSEIRFKIWHIFAIRKPK